jgi:hypothetical protein
VKERNVQPYQYKLFGIFGKSLIPRKICSGNIVAEMVKADLELLELAKKRSILGELGVCNIVFPLTFFWVILLSNPVSGVFFPSLMQKTEHLLLIVNNKYKNIFI